MKHKPKPYFMVVGEGHPRFKHDEVMTAKEEARRLANKNPGIEFLVVKVIGCAYRDTPPDIYTEFSPLNDDEIPF